MNYCDKWANYQHVLAYYNRIDLWDDLKDSTLWGESDLLKKAARFAWGLYPGRTPWGD